MRYFILISTLIALLSFKQEQYIHSNTIKFLQDSGKKKTVVNKKVSKEEKWNIFWAAFTDAVNKKDTKRITELTAKDFYDGGGGTVEYWMESDIFLNDKNFNKYKSSLKKGAKYFKDTGTTYKATGKNDAGDLFFEYKNGQWLFGGIVAD